MDKVKLPPWFLTFGMLVGLYQLISILSYLSGNISFGDPWMAAGYLGLALFFLGLAWFAYRSQKTSTNDY
ncbi:MAG: hypothetical protein AAGF89_14625 [Bacteroidota bacterium]